MIMTISQNKKIIPLFKDTYLATIKNSVGVKTWRNFYARVNSRKMDIVKNGDLSCAFFVSSILVIFGLLERIHGTVVGTVSDLKKSGWKKNKDLKPGAVIVWKEKVSKNGESHKHLGFFVGDKKAISNSSKTGQISRHHFTFGNKNNQPVRSIEAIYIHKKLN